MTLVDLASPSAVADFLQANNCCLVTFSAHWCGPCKASKPQLESLAQQYASTFKIAIAYESDLEDAIHQYGVRAFPTYIVFENGKEVERVEGANLAAVEQLVQKHKHKATPTGGESLGGGVVALSPAEARAARLAKLGGASAAAPSPVPPAAADDSKPPAAAKDTATEDVEMTDANAEEGNDKAEGESASTDGADEDDPVSKLDPQAIETLTSSMGFSLLLSQKGLLYGGPTVEAAVEWITQHQEDADIEEPIPKGAGGAGGAIPQSYKCNECGKILSNMANLELHANKTGHSDFEESTESVIPLTAEQKAAKVEEIKGLLKKKRAEREEREKEEEKEREKQRRFMGKEMAKTREQMEMEARKREAILRKKEKEAFKRERERLRAELAKDKAERQSQGGKLSSRLGVEGYNPDGIQYDVEVEGAGCSPAEQEEHRKKKVKADAAKIDEYIKKVSSYKAGGDGGKCLKILKIYVGNVVDNPDEEKFKTINMDNKAFKTKVKPFVGAKNILMAVGFSPNESGDALTLQNNADTQLLAETKQKLEAAIVAYG